MGVPTMLGKIDTRSPRFWLVVAFGLVCITPSTKPPVDAKPVEPVDPKFTPCPVTKPDVDVLAIDLGAVDQLCTLDLPTNSQRILIHLSSKRHDPEAYPEGSR